MFLIDEIAALLKKLEIQEYFYSKVHLKKPLFTRAQNIELVVMCHFTNCKSLTISVGHSAMVILVKCFFVPCSALMASWLKCSKF